jgi:hypothetical protein
MLKSLMLTVACAYINPPGSLPTTPAVTASVPEILRQAYAMEPGTKQEIVVDHGDGLCSRVVIETSTADALAAFVDMDAAKNFDVPMPRSRPVEADCPRATPDADAACHPARNRSGSIDPRSGRSGRTAYLPRQAQ